MASAPSAYGRRQSQARQHNTKATRPLSPGLTGLAAPTRSEHGEELETLGGNKGTDDFT